jgi:DNA polymerase I-like protein with 3'-5' exonuclease and polymerase domains
MFANAAAPYIIPPETDMAGSLRLVFDIEANGLLDTATKVHCIAIANLDQDEVVAYGPDEISAALTHLQRADCLISHNGIGYDLPLLRKLYDWAPPPSCKITDTLATGRLILPDIAALDDKAAFMARQKLSKEIRGSYSLAAWGTRLDIAKVGTDIEVWEEWTPEIQERCCGDARLTKALWHFLKPDGYDQRAIDLEHRATFVCERIKADGVPFDSTRAEQLAQQLTARRAVLKAKLDRQFPRVNLNSRTQLGAALEARGWVPEERTKTTKQPRITGEVLETIAVVYPEFAGLAEYLLLGRLLASLRTGKQAWLKHVQSDGRIHGSVIHIGAPHSRAKHFGPNIAQVPNPKKGKPFGAECRSLFHSMNDWVFVAADQAQLQDRGLAHYLHPHDEGAYGKTFADGTDSHWKSATALGLVNEGTERVKDNKLHTTLREWAKTFRYMTIFGGKEKRAGWTIYNTVRGVKHLDSGDLYRKFFGDAARPVESTLKRVGGKARNAFIDSMPGFRGLLQKLENSVRRYGWLPGLDGRRVPARSLHVALNYIIVASEAIICKRWLVLVHDELRARFRYGWDGDVVLVLWVQDELVACCKPEIADQVGEIMARNGREAGEFYGFRVPLQADYTVGRGWAEPPEQTEVPEQQGDEAPIELESVDGAQAKAEPLPEDDPSDDDASSDDETSDDDTSDDDPSDDGASDDEASDADDGPDGDHTDDDTPPGGSGPHGRGVDDDFEDEPANGKVKPPKPFSDAHLKRQGYQEVLPNFDYKLVGWNHRSIPKNPLRTEAWHTRDTRTSAQDVPGLPSGQRRLDGRCRSSSHPLQLAKASMRAAGLKRILGRGRSQSRCAHQGRPACDHNRLP